MSLVEVALAILLVGALAAVIIALSTTLRAGTEAEGDWKGFLAATTLTELAGAEVTSLPSCPATQVFALGERSYQVCLRERLETAGTLSRLISTVEVNEGGDRVASLTWVQMQTSPPTIPGTCAGGNRRQVILNLSSTGMTYVAFALTWYPNVPTNQRLRIFRQQSPLTVIHYLGNYSSGSGYVSFSVPLSLVSTTRIRLDFSRNFNIGTNYTFELRLRDFLGREYLVTPCTVRW